jgi:hypothetical protein
MSIGSKQLGAIVIGLFSELASAQFTVCAPEFDRLVSYASQRPAGSYSDSRIPAADRTWVQGEIEVYADRTKRVAKMPQAEMQEAARNLETDLRNIQRGIVPLPDAFAKKRAELSMEAWVCFYKAHAESSGTSTIQQRAAGPNNQHSQSARDNFDPQSSSQSASGSLEESKRRALGLQARGDAAAQKKGRRVHSAALEAHDCVSLDRTLGLLYGGFRNSCPYKIVVSYCNFRPKPDTWGQGVNCEKKQGIGATFIGANQGSVDHTNGAEFVYWFACRDPSWPVEAEYSPGQGLMARCRED